MPPGAAPGLAAPAAPGAGMRMIMTTMMLHHEQV
jgi:hypothetical protein